MALSYNQFEDNRYSQARVEKEKKTLDLVEYKEKQIARKRYLRWQRQQAKRRFVFFLTIFIVASYFCFNFLYRNIVLPVANSGVELHASDNFFHSTDAVLTPTNFMGSKDDITSNQQFDSKELVMQKLPLRRELRGLKQALNILFDSAGKDFKPGLFIWDSKTRNYVSINGEDAFSTASIVKIPILLEMFRQIDKNLLSLDKKVEFNKFHLASGSGGLQYQYDPSGKTYSLDYLAELMIKCSDNTATNIILDQIGGADYLNKAMQSWGFKNAAVNNWLPDLTGTNVISPIDFATMLYNVSNSKFLTSYSSGKIIDYMSKIKNRRLIKCGMPSGSKIAHKTGDIGSMVGDAGIVVLPNGRKIIMVAMVSRPWNSYKAKELIRNASKITFNYFSRYE